MHTGVLGLSVTLVISGVDSSALATADALPFAEKELDGDVVRGVTEEMAVTEMHAKAKELRLGGAAVFFAAMEG